MLELTPKQRKDLSLYAPKPAIDCPHREDGRLICAVRRKGGKRLAVVLECQRCGAVGTTVPWREIGLEEGAVKGLKAVSDDLKAEWQERRKRLRQMREADHEADMRAIYASPWWSRAKELVFARDGYKCQACLLRPATTVHHKRYLTRDGRRVGGEPLYWLVSVCECCHQPGDDSKHREPNYLETVEYENN